MRGSPPGFAARQVILELAGRTTREPAWMYGKHIVDKSNHLPKYRSPEESSMPAPKSDPVESIRKFNRFYTRQLGLLDQSHLASEYSLTEARLLYELAHDDTLTATDLRNALGLDAGYLSRLLKGLEKRKLIRRTASAADARQSALNLTRKGRDEFGPLNKAARAQIASMIDELPADAVRTLVESMSNVQRLLAPDSHPAVPYMVRPFQVGDIGWIGRASCRERVCLVV